MTHAKTGFRNAFYEAVRGLSTTSDRAYKTRIMPLENENLPGLCVHLGDESIDEEMGKVAGIQHRVLEVIVAGYDKLSTGLDDQLDTIEAEVEAAIFAANIPNVYGLDLISSEQEIEEGLEKPVGKTTMTWRVQYLTEEGAPGTAL